ncbi:MAG: hypothetical protein RLZZ370_860 [Bacteroidota bacterium]|jgi:uncharacterized protein YkwD
MCIPLNGAFVKKNNMNNMPCKSRFNVAPSFPYGALFWLPVFLLMFAACGIRSDMKHREVYSQQELNTVQRCNTARLAFYMRKRCRRMVLMSNLLRKDPLLLHKYMSLQTDSNSTNSKSYFARLNIRQEADFMRETPLLKPSFGLYVSSKIHAINSGINGRSGHQGLDLRMRLGLNWNRIYGENCFYGRLNEYEMMVGWINSDGHYGNLVAKGYYRIGISGFWHRKFGQNYVQVFSGRKPLDLFR